MFEENFLPDLIDGDVEMLPLISEEEEVEMHNQEIPELLPILSLRNTVLFPGVIIPITVGRDKSIALIKEANSESKIIGVVAQKDTAVEDPKAEDLYKFGTVAKIVKMLRMPDGNVTVIIQGRRRFEITEMVTEEPFLKAKVKLFNENDLKESQELKALVSTIEEQATKIIKLSPNIPTEATIAIKNIESPTFLINFVSSNLNVDVKAKQSILETNVFFNKCEKVLLQLHEELQLLKIKKEIQVKVDVDMEKQQRQFILHQQLKTIQDELGNEDPEVEKIIEKSKKKKWPKKVGDAFNKEVAKLKRLNSAMPDYSVTLNYLEYLIDLPWESYSSDDFDLKKASLILDKHHSGLEKVKKRIIEYLAVLKLKGDMKSPIICLVGPPGVGKTSLGKSIAASLNREFVRMSLGGLRDESEIRGHRKTYIGAMPGRIIQSIKKAKKSNPVFILDEIDKVGNDGRADPSSALLEVLDPEQNDSFYDNYLELEYDLSKVMFIATANSLGSIQPALRDRMEIIEVNGYTIEEKLDIAKKHLIPKLRTEHGLKAKDIKLSNKLIEKVIEEYTRESGVRGLDKKLASLMRSIAKSVAMEEKYAVNVKPEQLKEILGISHFDREIYTDIVVPGVAVGLAWTSVGGDILFIEASLSQGKGGLTLTGNLGDVMKESATTALSYIKSHANDFGIDPKIFDNWNLHIHVPEGAIPKDGPSAGITMLSAMVSAFKQQPLRAKLAMTGEITLRGKVLPVGGIKEKILAAKRSGINHIILCEKNRKDIEEIKLEHIKDVTFYYVKNMQDVVDIALSKKKVSNAIDFAKLLKEANKEKMELN